MHHHITMSSIVYSIFLHLISIPELYSYAYPTDNNLQCVDLRPKHGTKPQTSPSPFSITFDPANYTPGSYQSVMVTIQASEAAQFKGFIIQARHVENPPDLDPYKLAKGKFHIIPDTTHTCHASSLCHDTPKLKSNLTFDWYPYQGTAASGNVIFLAAFVQDKLTYWANVKSEVLKTTRTSTTLASTASTAEAITNFTAANITTASTSGSTVAPSGSTDYPLILITVIATISIFVLLLVCCCILRSKAKKRKEKKEKYQQASEPVLDVKSDNVPIVPDYVPNVPDYVPNVPYHKKAYGYFSVWRSKVKERKEKREKYLHASEPVKSDNVPNVPYHKKAYGYFGVLKSKAKERNKKKRKKSQQPPEIVLDVKTENVPSVSNDTKANKIEEKKRKSQQTFDGMESINTSIKDSSTASTSGFEVAFSEYSY